MSKFEDLLNKEKAYLWEKTSEIEENIRNLEARIRDEFLQSGTDLQKNANYSSRKVTEYKNKSNVAKQEAEAAAADSKDYLSKIENIYSETSSNSKEIEKYLSDVKSETEKLDELLGKTTSIYDEMCDQYRQLSELPNKYISLGDDLSELEENIGTAESNTQKIKSLLTQSISHKNKLTEIYDEFYGYEEEDEDGNVHKEKGKLDQLDSEHSQIKSDLEETKNELIELSESSNARFNELLDTHKAQFDNFLSEKEDNIQSIEDKIKSLLPNALTAGLSHAYEAKKLDEVENHQQLNKYFYYSIIDLNHH